MRIIPRSAIRGRCCAGRVSHSECCAFFSDVGAEVAIGSLIVYYLEPNVLGLSALHAGEHVPVLLGRGDGGTIHRRLLATGVSPGRVLACNAAPVLARFRSRRRTRAGVAAAPLLAVGLFDSIMFPPFSRGERGTRAPLEAGSGLPHGHRRRGHRSVHRGPPRDRRGLQFGARRPRRCATRASWLSAYMRAAAAPDAERDPRPCRKIFRHRKVIW